MGYNQFKNIINIDQKIVVFGGCGFIGFNIAKVLAKLGNEVLIIDDLSNSSVEILDEIIELPNVKFVKLDICKLNELIKVTEGYDYFINNAAYGSIPRSVEFPELYITNNVEGTFNVFKAAVKNNIKGVVYASSSSVYGDSKTLPKKENETGKVLAPYALSKKQNEEWATMFKDMYNLNVIGLRYFNVFGPYQRHDSTYAAVLPIFIDKINHKKEIEIHGDGLQSRDFTYVDNVIYANLLSLANAEKFSGEAYNVACNEEITLLDILKCIEQKTNLKAKIKYVDSRVGDIRHSKADISKIKNDLGYQVLVNYETGIEKTIKYFDGLKK